MNLIELVIWYLGNIWEYVLQMLPCMLLALLAFLSLRPARASRLERLGLFSPPGRERALMLFVMFCAGLAALTLFPARFWDAGRLRQVFLGERPLFPAVDLQSQLRNLQTTPFQEIRRAFRGPWVMFLMLANIGIFCPLGFFPALLARRPRWWKSALVGLGCSCAIEFIQFFIGRSSDVDDVILNTAGALAGYWLFCLLRALFPQWIIHFQCCERKGPKWTT